MNYANSNAFTGTVQNTTNNGLTNVRIEVHLSHGVELGPTTPLDMAAGEVTDITLPATPASFTGWVPHAEVGSGEGGGDGSDDVESCNASGPDVERRAGRSRRATTRRRRRCATAQKTTQQTLCYVQSEPHLKSRT